MIRTTFAAVAACAAFTVQAQTKWDMPTPYADGEFHTRNVAAFVEEVPLPPCSRGDEESHLAIREALVQFLHHRERIGTGLPFGFGHVRPPRSPELTSARLHLLYPDHSPAP